VVKTKKNKSQLQENPGGLDLWDRLGWRRR